MGRVGDVEFKATGKEILSLGWRVLYQDDIHDDSDDKEDPEEKMLPSFIKNESGPHQPVLQAKMTTPPKPYTEATLLQAMETAGKFVDSEELKAVMKENGIGRPSSRAAIIETLFKRNYIARNKKSINATSMGHQLIDLIQYDLLKSCELTGIWEKKLREIERGKYDVRKFIDELKEQLLMIVNSVKADDSRRYVCSLSSARGKREGKEKTTKSTPTGTKKPVTNKKRVIQNQLCPLCKKGHIIKGKYSYFCSRHNEGCKFKSFL